MLYRRITGNEVFFDTLADMKTRLGTLETQPSGNIVVRDTLSTTDPETGVSTLIGVLPDGTTGLQQFVNDVIPPGQPSAPLLAPVIDAIAVEWDGLDAEGGAQPKDYDRTEIMYRSSGSQEAWVLGGVLYGATRALIVNLTAGVHYEIRLVSYDKNDNASIPSGIRSETAAAVLDSSDVAEAIDEVREAAATAVANSASAQSAAATAQSAAEDAARDALAAADLAAEAGKGSTVFSDTAPTDAASTTGSTLWIDISGTPPKNTPNRWDGKKWVAITDTAATAAAAKAAEAEARANAAEASAIASAKAAGLAQTAADGKNKVWYLDTAPAGNSHNTNDIWFDAANGNRPMRWNGANWVTAQDASIAAAKTVADSALTSANGKNKTYYQNTKPTGGTYTVGDTWFDTANGYALYTYTAPNVWTKTQDSAQALKDAKADTTSRLAGKTKTWVQAAQPSNTGNITGDTWIDSDDGNKLYVWNGAAWVSAQDTAIATAKGAADTALTAANGKNKIIFSASDASGTTGYTAGDMWMKRDASGTIIGQWEFTTSWQKRTIGETVIGNLSAGKITSGTVHADRLAADDIRAKIIAADKISATDILVPGSITAASAVIAEGAIGTAQIGEAAITNAKISDLNASKINAGIISADRLAANDIRAKIISADDINAEDILASGSITATNGIIGSLDANKITAGTLNAARIGAQTITADKVILGQGANLITDPSFVSAESNAQRAAKSTGTWTFGVDASTKVNCASTTTTTTNNAFIFSLPTTNAANVASMVPVVPGEKYLMSASTSTNVVAGVRWNVYVWKSDGAVVYNVGSPTNTATGRRTIEWEYVIPADAVAFSPVLSCLTSGVNWVVDAGAMCVRKTEGRLIVDGAITSKKLETDLVLTTKIIAGDPTGVRAEMAPEGFKVFGKASGDTTSTGTYEIVRLGVADTNDMFAIADKDGITQASISETGIVSGKQLYASQDIVFKGQALSDILWSMPRGHVASAFRTTHSANNAKPGGEWAPYMRLEVNVERNRLYKISTSPLKFGQDAGGSASIRIVQSTGSVATTSSVTIDNIEIESGVDGNSAMLSEYTQIGGAKVDGPSGDVVMVSYLLMFKAHRGQFGMRATAMSPARLMIEDMGPLRNAYTGIHLDTTWDNGVPPAAPPAKSTHTTTWDCNWIRSFDGNGNHYNYNANKGYQGLSPAGYGNMKTVMNFPDMTGTLSGSVVHEIKVYLYFEHWYYNAGGTARIGLSGGPANSYGGQNPVVTSGGWPKPGGRWVTIPTNHYYGFVTGANRGITLEGDGTYGTYGIVHPGKIEITYTK